MLPSVRAAATASSTSSDSSSTDSLPSTSYANGKSHANGVHHHSNGVAVNGHPVNANGAAAHANGASIHANGTAVHAANGVPHANGAAAPELPRSDSLASTSSSLTESSVESSATVQPAVAHEPQPEASTSAPSIPVTTTTTATTASQTADAAPAPVETGPGHIPRPILVISFVSATLTMASCVFNTLLPIYMVTELKMSMRSMGMFEGLLEAFSYVVRMFSGVVSDMMTSRKAAITLGFAMGAAAKFGMSGAGTVGQLFASKAIDRLANGVQAAPRDALISDLAPATSRSACFGFAQSMRKWGSFMGAGLSFFLMKASGNNYKLIFLMAATVSVASCLAFVFLVPAHVRPTHAAPAPAAAAGGAAGQEKQQQEQKPGFNLAKFWGDVKSMGPDFYRMLAVIAMYGMGHINESMLEARAIEVGFGKAESTLVVALLAFMIFLSAYPLGRLDDKYGPRVTFAVGMGALIAGNLTLLMSTTQPWAVFAACVFLGMHWAVIQGPLLSIVVGLAPANLRGTAFGIFYTVMALTAVAANSLYGSVWTAMGAPAAFTLSASLMAVSLLALPSMLPKQAQAAPKLKPA